MVPLAMPHELTKAGFVPQFPRRSGPACLVTIYGRDLGRRWMLDGTSFVIGRGDACQVMLDMENVSRRHCEIVLAPNGAHRVSDLRSTNGTFVNNDELKAPRDLRSGDLLKVGGTVFKYLDGDSLESLFHEEIYRMTIVDGLTQVFNKRYLLEFLDREMSRCLRYGRALSLLMIDLDHFKRINDTHGHIAGDHALREVAQAIAKHVRKEECFARYGGEEFALVMPEADPIRVRAFAEKLRSAVAALDLRFEGRTMPVTLSIGIANMTAETTEPEHFLAAADARLYEAKRDGRNRVAG